MFEREGMKVFTLFKIRVFLWKILSGVLFLVSLIIVRGMNVIIDVKRVGEKRRRLIIYCLNVFLLDWCGRN